MRPVRCRPGSAPRVLRAVVVLSLCASAAFILAAAARSAGASNASETLSFYSTLTARAFVNNADDRARGQGHNPFGSPSSAAPSPPTNEKVFGPFPGDTGEYMFKLYADAGHTSASGSAIFICNYTFDAGSLCFADFLLTSGDLVVKGLAAFESKTFTLGIVGGTGRYRNVTGELEVSGLGIPTQPQPAVRAVPMIQSQHLVFTLGTTPPARARTIVRYSNVTHESFVNNDDDEARGDVNNPFGAHDNKAAATEESAGGPFPGDEALFDFSVFSDSKLNNSAGSGFYSCEYYFVKSAFCEETIDLDGGTLSADGALDFGARSWTMAITGGTGKYSGLAGEVQATPDGSHAQRLVFRLG